MRAPRLIVIFSLAAIVAACSTGGGPRAASPSIAPSAASGAPAASAAITRIEVKLLDTLRMEPASMTVPGGVPVTFVVTNTGSTEHEFYIGDEAAQAEHEQGMMTGGMAHSDPAGIAVKPGETKELTHTFAQGPTLAGCHVVGHYGGGMKATITVTG